MASTVENICEDLTLARGAPASNRSSPRRDSRNCLGRRRYVLAREKPEWAIIGIASPGGKISATLKALALSAARRGLSIVNSFHDYLSDVRG
jgi:hypothetical protein